MEATSNLQERIRRNSSPSQIVKFYEGRSVFITGVTGFLGTVFIEKLLYSCEHIKNIYVLLKEKRGTAIEKRLEQMWESPAFYRIKEHRQESIKKVIPIKGDLTEHNLGMTENYIRLLQNEVSIVFHIAANISFNMELSESINTNTKATQTLIGICKRMPNLTAFVYVSSGYSQSNKLIVDETFYEPAVSVEKILEIIDIPNSCKISKNLMEGRPNTYTYSKALSEEIIRKNDEIPAAIVRPTMVLSAMKEPLPGWITSWAGSTGVIEAAGRGLWLCWNSDPSIIFDIVPVDYVANLMIATAWDTHNRNLKGEIQKETKAKVFNYSSSIENPIDTETYLRTCLEQNRKTSGNNPFFTNQLFIFKENYLSYCIVYFVLQTFLLNVISFIIDSVLWLTGRETRMLKLQRNLAKLVSVTQLFTQRQILFLNGNVRRLYQTLNETDRRLFDFDINHVHWESYLRDYVVGIKKYLLKK